MKVSSKVRYGVQAMFDLALHIEDGAVGIKTIAARQNVSEAFLEKLMSLLKKAGLVHSVRGAQGGYLMAKNPKDISVGDIIRALEGPMESVVCVSKDDKMICDKSRQCVYRVMWQKVTDKIDQAIDDMSLQDMLFDYEKLRKHH